MPKDIVTILTVWKRNNLEKQIHSLIAQDIRPRRVIVYQNENHVDIRDLVEKYGLEHIHSVNCNHKFHGRFTLPLLLKHEYCVIYDDDTISNKNWFRTCLDTINRHNCIVGCNGRIIKSDYQLSETGPLSAEDINTYNVRNLAKLHMDRRVDFTGHCWFFKTEWAKYMWMTDACSFETGEDISFSAACKIHGGIETYIPKSTADNMNCWGSIEPELGKDKHAAYINQENSLQLRQEIVNYWIGKGWRPMFMEE